MATDTRPGFRLPWAAENESDDTHPTEQSATGNAPVAEDSREAEEPEMIEPAETAAAPAAQPSAPEEPRTRRATKFMAELSRAMQVAAENARAELMTRFEAEAKGVVEEVHTGATDEAAGLRRKADDDVAAIREWSKAEVARIKEETDARIAARKTGLEAEMEEHAATVEARIERVSAVVAAFETQMTAFFERLNAEEDPTRIATMAETMPEPPSLAEVAASIASGAVVQPTSGSADPAANANNGRTAEIDFAAAEAEAASFSGDLEAEDDLPTEGALAENEGIGGPGEAFEDAPSTPSTELASSRIVVSGLASVANIANFKRSLSRTSGVASIGVASGPDGNFVFTVGHTLGSALSASVQELSGFDVQITGDSDGAIIVVAQDRDATD
jgi:hypothetical protein